MSFSYEPFSRMILVAVPQELPGDVKFAWECDSCGADSNRPNTPYWCVTDNVALLWDEWVKHLTRSHKLTPPPGRCKEEVLLEGGVYLQCIKEQGHHTKSKHTFELQ